MKYVIKKYFNLGPGVFVYNPESEEGCFISCGMYSFNQIEKALTEFPVKKISVCLNTWGSLAGLYTYNEEFPEVKLDTFICPKSDYNIKLPFEHFCVMESPNESYKIYDWLSVSAMLLDNDEKIEYEFQAQVFNKKVLVQSWMPALHKDDVDILVTPIYSEEISPKNKFLVYFGIEDLQADIFYLSLFNNEDITFVYENSSVYIKTAGLTSQFERLLRREYGKTMAHLYEEGFSFENREPLYTYLGGIIANIVLPEGLDIVECKKRINELGYTNFNEFLDDEITLTENLKTLITQGIPATKENLQYYFENGSPKKLLKDDDE